MKLIIIEGTDRTGKDTLCNELKGLSDQLIYRHWGFPEGETNEERIKYQQTSFKKEFDLYHTMNKDKYFSKGMNMIWNRSHLGEVVYGTLYRDYDPEKWVYNLETLYSFDQKPEIYLIWLYADAEFVCANDDGESFTNDVVQKKVEIGLFEKAFNNSIIQNKLKVQVNEGHSYRDRREITKSVTSFIMHQHEVQGSNI